MFGAKIKHFDCVHQVEVHQTIELCIPASSCEAFHLRYSSQRATSQSNVPRGPILVIQAGEVEAPTLEDFHVKQVLSHNESLIECSELATRVFTHEERLVSKDTAS